VNRNHWRCTSKGKQEAFGSMSPNRRSSNIGEDSPRSFERPYPLEMPYLLAMIEVGLASVLNRRRERLRFQPVRCCSSALNDGWVEQNSRRALDYDRGRQRCASGQRHLVSGAPRACLSLVIFHSPRVLCTEGSESLGARTGKSQPTLSVAQLDTPYARRCLGENREIGRL
jgi:hypothetical protein